MLQVVTFCLLWALLYWIGQKCFLGKKYPDRVNGRLVNGAFVACIAFFLLKFFFGARVPGSWFERSRYSADVFVNLFPDGSGSQNYRVPAHINADFEADDDGEHGSSYRVYWLRHVTVKGRRITFQANDEPLVLGRRASLRDDAGRLWGVELTSTRVR